MCCPGHVSGPPSAQVERRRWAQPSSAHCGDRATLPAATGRAWRPGARPAGARPAEMPGVPNTTAPETYSRSQASVLSRRKGEMSNRRAASCKLHQLIATPNSLGCAPSSHVYSFLPMSFIRLLYIAGTACAVVVVICALQLSLWVTL
jgi:hypothetical protein